MSQKMRSQVESIKPLSEDQLSQVVGGTGYDKHHYYDGYKYKLGLVIPYIRLPLPPFPVYKVHAKHY